MAHGAPSGRQPGRPGPRRAIRRRRRPLVVVAWVLAGVLAGTTVVGAVALHRLQGNIRTQDIAPLLGASRPAPAPTSSAVGGRPVNFMVLGSDSRAGADSFIGGVDNGARSDTALLVHLSADRTRAVAVSIPRDSIVALPNCTRPTGATVPGSVRMFNDAFTTGGPACTVKAVESLTGIRIDHYVVVDFAGFKDVVDALGSVQICLAAPVRDPAHHIDLPAGRSTVDGTTALAYVRERYKIGDGGDLGRIDRQQAFLSSVLQQAVSAGTLTNPWRLYAFLDAATRSLTMDPELAGLTTLAGFAADVNRVGVKNIRFLTVPNGADPTDPNRLVWLPSATALWAAIRDDLPLTTTPKPSSAGRPSPSLPSTSRSSSPSASGSATVVIKDATGRTADADICSS